jgi:hypothetical protein
VSDPVKHVSDYLDKHADRIPIEPVSIGICMWHGHCLSIGHGIGTTDCRKQTEGLLILDLIRKRDEHGADHISDVIPFESTCNCQVIDE